MAPEGIQYSSDDDGLKSFTIYITLSQTLSSNVVALTGRALKRGAKVIPLPSLPEPNFILHLGQAGSIEISGNSYLESVVDMWSEALGTPSTLTRMGGSAAVAIVCADNPRREGDMTVTFLTGHVLLPPPPLVGA